jgi:hypothetical protein
MSVNHGVDSARSSGRELEKFKPSMVGAMRLLLSC